MENSQLSINTISAVTVFTKYSKYLVELSRRESFIELQLRYRNMLIKKYPFLREEIISTFDNYVLTKKVLGSMRASQFAGSPIERNEARIYNCAFLPIDSWEAFHETMFLLLSGCGVGYSVQKAHIAKLPSIRRPSRSKKFLIQDDIIGWSEAVKALIRSYLDGSFEPRFDFSDIRAKGTMLKTSGGKAPGPDPLRKALSKIKEILESKENGSRLTSLECHDIQCFISDAVLAGGIRRAAMISLFNIDDADMLSCKSNFPVDVLDYNQVSIDSYQVEVRLMKTDKKYTIYLDQKGYADMRSTNTVPWHFFEPQRGRSNNSAVLVRHKAKKRDFLDLWKKIEDSNAGEPGIFFSNNADWGTNPCCEVSLRPYQFCNLTEINGATILTQEELNARAKAGAFLGTLQAGFTDLHYLREVWITTTERDSLIGVGITGTASMDFNILNLTEATDVVKDENERIAALIGINPAARCCVIKPSGTTSLVLGTSSGAHAWMFEYYIRRMKVNKQESIYRYFKSKMPQLLEDDFYAPNQDAFLCIPMHAPAGSIISRDETAIQFLDRVKHLSLNWIKPGHRSGDNTNNVSATVYVKPDEWKSVGEWMWENRDAYNGMSMLPYDGGTYIQTPFEEITAEKYEEMVKHLTDIDLTQVIESEDKTKQAEEAACVNGVCERQY